MERTIGSWVADSDRVCLIVTTTGAAPMPESVPGGGRMPLSRVVVSQLQGELLGDLQLRLEHRLRVLRSRRQSVDCAVLMVGPALTDATGTRRALALLLSECLGPEGELSLVAQPGDSDAVRTELFELFEAVAGSLQNSKKEVTIRFLAAKEESQSGVWERLVPDESDAEVA